MISDHKWKWLYSWEELRNAKLHFKRIRRIICYSRRKKKRYLNFSTNQNLDELLKNELNHEEPPWRTPVTIGWWDRMKEERIRWALRWFRCWFRRNGWGNWTPEKKRWKTLGTRIYSSRTNSEGRDYSLWGNKNKIYCMLILHQIKLMTSNGFCILLILLEKDWEVTYRKLEKVFMNHR